MGAGRVRSLRHPRSSTARRCRLPGVVLRRRERRSAVLWRPALRRQPRPAEPLGLCHCRCLTLLPCRVPSPSRPCAHLAHSARSDMSRRVLLCECSCCNVLCPRFSYALHMYSADAWNACRAYFRSWFPLRSIFLLQMRETNRTYPFQGRVAAPSRSTVHGGVGVFLVDLKRLVMAKPLHPG